MTDFLAKFKENLSKINPKFLVLPAAVLLVVVFAVLNFSAGVVTANLYPDFLKPYLEKLNLPLISSTPTTTPSSQTYVPQTTQEQAVIKTVKDVSPAVVSIIITKDLPVVEQYYTSPFEQFFNFQIPQYRQIGTQKQEIGGGSGFIISSDGLVLTNKHVASDTEADYTVLTNDGKKYPAKVLAKDPVQDLAVLKIEGGPFSVVRLGDSSKLEIGQSVIAIGNALGEFRNTISVGVVSGLGRTITASGGGLVETLEDVIQTDAAINKGNSGGPLLNLRGEVIGINTATVQDAQSIGFAIPINFAKKDIQQVQASGKISYAFLGVRYVLVTDQIQKDNNLPVNYGAWVKQGQQASEVAVTLGSPADKAGIKDSDIILEFNNEKITTTNPLAKLIQKYNPGDSITLKILSSSKEKTVTVILGERSQ
jgi:S1-C subfamily serine protease